MVKIENKHKNLLTKLLTIKNNSDNKPQFGNLLSWEFIIDSEGTYLNISPEVTDCLGIPPSEFLDQSIFTFSINQSSGEKLSSQFFEQNFPLDLDVIFLSNNGNLLYCNLKLTKFSEEYQSKPTYIGIVQTLEDLHGSIKPKSEDQIPEFHVVETQSQTIEEEIQELFEDNKGNSKIEEQVPILKISEMLYSPKVLDNLQRYSAEVNHLIEPIDIYKLTYKVINEFIPNQNFSMGVSQKQIPNMIFPIRKVENEISYYPDNDDYEPVLKYIVQTNQVVIQNDQIPPSVKKIIISHTKIFPISLLGVPISAGNRVLGAILLHDKKDNNRFNDLDLQYLSAIGTKMATALENAFLFQEMQYALSVIETREQYQTLVSQSVKILANTGTKNLIEALELMGKASNVDRVFFAQSNVGNENQTWSIQSNWQSVEKYNTYHLTQHFLFTDFEEYIPALIDKGFFQVHYENLDRPVDEWLRNRGSKSILALAVNNGDSIPGIIVLEDLHQNHYWNVDEIRFLGLVSETLSSIIAYEKRINQLNYKLSETETINIIKENLFFASTIEEILQIVMKNIFSLDIIESSVYIFREPESTRPDHYEVVANWSKDPDTNQSIQTHTFDRNTVNSLFIQEFPTYFATIKNANLSNRTIQLLSLLNISSLGIIPLKSKTRKIGSIILYSDVVHEFSKKEQKFVEILLETITSSVEKILNLERSHKGFFEKTFFKNINKLIKTQNPHDILLYLSEYIHESSVGDCSFFVLERIENQNSFEFFEINKEFSMNVISSLHNDWKSIRFNNLLNELIKLNIDYFDNFSNFNLQVEILETLNNYKIESSYFFPLYFNNLISGYITIISNKPCVINPEKISHLKYAANELSILLTNRASLRDFSELNNKINIAASIVHDTSSILNLDLLIKKITKQIQQKFGFLSVGIHVCNNENKLLDKASVSNDGYDDFDQHAPGLKENSYPIILDVFEKGQAINLRDVSDQNEDPFNLEKIWTKSQLVLPLKMGENIIGVLDIHSNQSNGFESKDLPYYQLLADQIAIEIEIARLYEKSQNVINDISDMDKIKSQFLANMSHEFRTPLNSIIGFSKVILTGIDGPINETQKQDLTAIHNAGQYLLRLVNDILDITKIEAGTMKLTMDKTNIPNLIQSLLPSAENLAKDKVIKFDVVNSEDLPELLVDRDRISQVLMNLISNAVKFTEYGKITISTSLAEGLGKNQEVMITISDTGIGINQVDQAKLFRPFEQASSTENIRAFGSGLGLAISKSLIQLHRGRIGLLKSSPGKGSTFFIALPVS
jgi:signal transduction histidine kinase